MAKVVIDQSSPVYDLYVSILETNRSIQSRAAAGLAVIRNGQAMAVTEVGRLELCALLVATNEMLAQIDLRQYSLPNQAREAKQLRSELDRVRAKTESGGLQQKDGRKLLSQYQQSTHGLILLAQKLDRIRAERATTISGITAQRMTMPSIDPIESHMLAIGSGNGSMEARVNAGSEALFEAVSHAVKPDRHIRYRAAELIGAVGDMLQEIESGSQRVELASPIQTNRLIKILSTFLVEVESGRVPSAARWSSFATVYEDWLKDLTGTVPSPTTTKSVSPAVSVRAQLASPLCVEDAFTQLYAALEDANGRTPNHKTAAKRVWLVYAWLDKLPKKPDGKQFTGPLLKKAVKSREQLLLKMAMLAPDLEAAVRGSAPPKMPNVMMWDEEHRFYLEVLAGEAVSCELIGIQKYTPKLRTRLLGGQLPALTPAMVRVFGWLQDHRDLIVAGEVPEEQGIDRRAVAGAIAWEALENVQEKLTVAVGVGKPHVRALNLGIHKVPILLGPERGATHGGQVVQLRPLVLESAAGEVEELGYLPKRSYLGNPFNNESVLGGERAAEAETISGAVAYIVAIMRAGADTVQELVNESIRRRPDILTNMYQRFTVKEWRRHILEKLRTGSGRTLVWQIKDPMPTWVRKFDLYLRLAVGEPTLSLDSHTQGALLRAVQNALADSSCATGCNFFVIKVAEQMGIRWLGGMQANAMVDAMESKCETVGSDQARLLAEEGSLIVAGRKEQPNGHVAVVVPGPGRFSADGTSWFPNVASTSMRGTHSAAYSTGDKTVNEVWRKAAVGGVRYFRLTA